LQLQHRYLSLEPFSDLDQPGEDDQNLLVPPAAAPIVFPPLSEDPATANNDGLFFARRSPEKQVFTIVQSYSTHRAEY
jgi:hypothetical protein